MQPAKERRDAVRLVPKIDAVGFASVMLVVLFALMLPFLITSPSHGGHDVNLARVHHPIPMPGANREDAIVIGITRDGMVYLGSYRLTLVELPLKIHQMIKQGSPRVAYFKVDARTRYRCVSDVLDNVSGSGLEKIAFLVEEQKPKQ